MNGKNFSYYTNSLMLIVINFRTSVFSLMLKFSSIGLLLIGTMCFSQTVNYSVYEKKWAIKHPFSTIKVKKISRHCFKTFDRQALKLELDSFNNGGKLDAYRHVFFMAAYAQKIPASKLRALGLAHEKTNYRQFLQGINEDGELPDSIGSVMDLFNNELGLSIGKTYRDLNLEELGRIVITTLKKGEARIVKRNNKGVYLTCEEQVLDPKTFKGIWSIPKCLVRSDYNYP